MGQYKRHTADIEEVKAELTRVYEEMIAREAAEREQQAEDAKPE